MQAELDIVVGLIAENGGVMEYPAIYEHPSVTPFNNKLHLVKNLGRQTGQIQILPVAVNDDGKMVSRWAVGGE